MSMVDHLQRQLEKLAPEVRAKLEEVGLDAALERLLGELRGAQVDDDGDVRPMQDLLDWTLCVLLSASEPLDRRVLQALQDNFSQASDHADAGDWDQCVDLIHPILVLLACVPRRTTGQALEAASTLTTMLGAARDGLAEAGSTVSTRRREVESGFEKEAETLVRGLSDKRDAAAAEMARCLDDLQERYGFTAGQVLGGAHELAAKTESELAERHHTTSQKAMWSACVLALAAAFLQWLPWAPDWDQWLDVFRNVPVIGSPIVVLLFIGRREGIVAAQHREQHDRLRSLALQFKSWEPYRSTLNHLDEGRKAELEALVARRLFAGDPVIPQQSQQGPRSVAGRSASDATDGTERSEQQE